MGKLNIRQLELGHRTLDREHIVICHRLAELSEVEDHTSLPRVLQAVLEELLDHQTKEEDAMFKLGYPGLEEHTSAHLVLYELYSALEEPTLKGYIPPAVSSEVMGRCLALHILLEDKRLVDFLALNHPEVL